MAGSLNSPLPHPATVARQPIMEDSLPPGAIATTMRCVTTDAVTPTSTWPLDSLIKRSRINLRVPVKLAIRLTPEATNSPGVMIVNVYSPRIVRSLAVSYHRKKP